MNATLMEGHRRFRRYHWPQREEKLRLLAATQRPQALYLGCADSRVVPNLFLDLDPGELFVVRQIAAIVPDPTSAAARPLGAALAYVLEVLRVEHIIVCGHDHCGGLGALLAAAPTGEGELTQWLREAGTDEEERARLAALPPSLAVEEFIAAQLNRLRRFPVVAAALAQNRVQLEAWVYDLTTGCVRRRQDDGRFVPLPA